MRLGRGDMRGLLLVGLRSGPAHGYELMHRLADVSGGTWSPSPGSVYPTLALLEDEGLLTCVSRVGKKTYSLTAAGATEAAAAAAAPTPRERDDSALAGRFPLREITHAVHGAARQVGQTGSPAQIDAAVGILTKTRRELYLLLADG